MDIEGELIDFLCVFLSFCKGFVQCLGSSCVETDLGEGALSNKRFLVMRSECLEVSTKIIKFLNRDKRSDECCGMKIYSDNSLCNVARPFEDYLENSDWEVLLQPPYIAELAPSDYNLDRSLQNAITGRRFASEQGLVKNVCASDIAKYMENVIALDG